MLTYNYATLKCGRYACLVAEQTSETDTSSSSSVVGVVDITVQTENSVLRHFPGEEEYLYVSGLAVSKAQRSLSSLSSLQKLVTNVVYKEFGFVISIGGRRWHVHC